MIDYNNFLDELEGSKLEALRELKDAFASGLSVQRYGDLPRWFKALEALAKLEPNTVDLKNQVLIGTQSELSEQERQELQTQLQALIPWRKGPFSIFGIEIDTEWRSDWKWQRVLPHLDPLEKRTILDVGCGNGYHCLRSYGAGASRVIGIDPSPRFIVQFYMLKHFLGQIPVDLLPIGIETLPPNLQAFDTTFSMGVLYHRRSPMDHLRELKETLRPGGQLVLETLVIEGELGSVLLPEGRYAMMNNVWFIPSVASLLSWLRKCGFVEEALVDMNKTTTQEQRTTAWMHYHSLADFLDKNDSERTVEGHPAPLRAVITARKPQ